MFAEVPPFWGYLNADQEALRRSRKLSPGRWRVPLDVKVRAGSLCYSANAFTTIWVPRRGERPFKWVKAGDLRVLTKFAELGQGDDAAIENYARRFGVLGLCEHGFPTATCPRAEYDETWHSRFCKPTGYPFNCSEPLSRWKTLAATVRALLDAMAQLHRGESVSEEAWKLSIGKISRESRSELNRTEQLRLIGLMVNSLLEIAPIRVNSRLTKEGRPELALAVSQHDFSQLLANLSLELLYQMTRVKRLLTCSNTACGKFYAPQRLPTRGENTYCSKCQKASRNSASLEWRANNPGYFKRRRAHHAETVKLHNQGASPPEIARQLKIDVKLVQNWIAAARIKDRGR